MSAFSKADVENTNVKVELMSALGRKQTSKTVNMHAGAYLGEKNERVNASPVLRSIESR